MEFIITGPALQDMLKSPTPRSERTISTIVKTHNVTPTENNQTTMIKKKKEKGTKDIQNN